MEAELMGTIRSVLERGDLMLRQQLRDFEAHLAAFVGTMHCVGTSNCTDALHLAMRAAGIGPGDEVITVSHTFVATAAAIHHTGATPVFVDIGDDHNMDVGLVETAITSRTKAIVPVHLNGRLCDMELVCAIARTNGLAVIEDAAQALGASQHGRKGGAWGLAGCFSFYPAKLLGAFGDAGAVATDSAEIAEKVRRLRDHGRLPDGDLAGWSFNCRLDNVQAAILDVKLGRVPSWIERRRDLAAIYHSELSGIRQLRLPPPPGADSRFFDVFQNYEIEATNRDGLVARLRGAGVEILVPWGGRAVHQFLRLGLGQYAGTLPRTEALFRGVLLLPLHTELNDEQARYVSRVIREFYAD
ncbi:MAG: DegT/DnrJ/EryC1/StrS family aminotransferase [Gemmatimonadales bacterium]